MFDTNIHSQLLHGNKVLNSVGYNMTLQKSCLHVIGFLPKRVWLIIELLVDQQYQTHGDTKYLSMKGFTLTKLKAFQDVMYT